MIANIITSCRIVLSVAMLFFPTLSPGFYAIYLAAGLTDMIDGPVARKMGTTSELGSRLDTVADILFVVAAAYKILPILTIPAIIWIWIGFIALIKLINIVMSLILNKQIPAVHSIANKVTGCILFLLPMTITIVDIRYSAAVSCAVATFAALQEGYYCLPHISESHKE